MGYYLLKRLVMTVLVIFVAMLFLGSLSHIVPGDPVKLMLGPRAKPEMIERVRVEMELDKPVPVQVLALCLERPARRPGHRFYHQGPGHALDRLGAAAYHRPGGVQPAAGLADRHPNGRVFGFPSQQLGRPDHQHFFCFADHHAHLRRGAAVAAAVRRGAALAARHRRGRSLRSVDYFKHLILPAVAMAVTWIGYLARLVRASTLEILNANYIRTAYAYGLSERLISYKYALKNSLIPTVAVLGVGLGNLLGGAIFVEVIFARPGSGLPGVPGGDDPQLSDRARRHPGRRV